MTIRIGINGFGRMGRLSTRAAWHWDNFEIVQVNEVAGDAASAAHLLKYDSVHGTWDEEISAADDALDYPDRRVAASVTARTKISRTPIGPAWIWLSSAPVQFKSQQLLAPYFDQGVKKVVVSAPVKDGTLNIVMGVNDP